MPLVASVDYATKRIYLTTDALGATFDTMQVYREVRNLRRTNESHRRYRPIIVGGGNIQKTASTYTQPYVQLLYGATLVPFDSSGKITLIRETFSDDGRSAAECFDRTTTVSNVDIDVQVPAVEVRTITVGGGSTADIANAVLAALQPDFNSIKGAGFTTDNHSLVKIKQQASLAVALSA
jgi:hypothetical protein